MVNDLSFSTYSEVMHSWERIRCIKDYDKTLGVLIFSKFFSKHPDATSLLGVDCEGEEFVKTDSFVPQAKKFIGLCDSFIDMLGPDAELMAKILEAEGRKHEKLGIKLEHYSTMGEALISGVKTLDEKFNDETELCWKLVYCGVTNNLGKANTFDEKSGRRHTM